MKLKKWFLAVICFLMIKTNIAQVNYISGNISHRKLGGGCGTSLIVEVTLTLYTKNISAGNKAVLSFGDGDTANVSRTDSVMDKNVVLKSTYKKTHYYANCGEYTIFYYDSTNMKNALNDIGTCKRFYIETLLSTNSLFSDVNSPVNYVSGANTASKNKSYNFNPTSMLAGNLFGDSTNHTLFSIGYNNAPCFVIPQGVKINRYSGEVIWTNPDTLGNYVFYITTKTYRFGNLRCSKVNYVKINVSNSSPTYQIDSLASIPLNNRGFKEFSFVPNNTYTYHMRYKDPAADSVRLFIYPLDFYGTLVQHTYTSVSSKDHLVKVNWSPTNADIRDYPYNVVINARSYYPNDSVANSYQTVSYRYANSVIGIKENSTNIKNGITIFPNPTKNEFTLTHSNSQYYTIQLVDVSGRILKSLNATENKVSINVSDLASGVYFVKTYFKNGQSINKLIIE